MRIRSVLIVSLALVASPAWADSTSVLVAPVRANGIDPDLLAATGELLASDLAAKTTVKVVSPAQLSALIKSHVEPQLLDDDDGTTLTRQMKSDYLVTSSLERVGRVFVLSIVLLPTSAAARQAVGRAPRHSAVLAQVDAETIIEGIDRIAATLADVVGHPAPGDATRPVAAVKLGRIEVMATPPADLTKAPAWRDLATGELSAAEATSLAQALTARARPAPAGSSP